MNIEELSNCCQAPVEVNGSTTKYYICTGCKEACDLETASYEIPEDRLEEIKKLEDQSDWYRHELSSNDKRIKELRKEL